MFYSIKQKIISKILPKLFINSKILVGWKFSLHIYIYLFMYKDELRLQHCTSYAFHGGLTFPGVLKDKITDKLFINLRSVAFE